MLYANVRSKIYVKLNYDVRQYAERCKDKLCIYFNCNNTKQKSDLRRFVVQEEEAT